MLNRIGAWIFLYGSALKSTGIRSATERKRMENARTRHLSSYGPYSSRHLSPLPDTRSTNSGQVNEASDHALDCSAYHALERNVRMQIQSRNDPRSAGSALGWTSSRR